MVGGKSQEDQGMKLPDSHLIHNLGQIPAGQDLHLPTQNGSIYSVCKASGWKDLQYPWKEKRKPNKLRRCAAQHKPSVPVTGNRLFIAEDH